MANSNLCDFCHQVLWDGVLVNTSEARPRLALGAVRETNQPTHKFTLSDGKLTPV
jgi:hypothetical protein